MLRSQGITGTLAIATGTEAEVLATLDSMPLATWRDRIEALPKRLSRVRLAVARPIEPEATRMILPSLTMENLDEARG